MKRHLNIWSINTLLQYNFLSYFHIEFSYCHDLPCHFSCSAHIFLIQDNTILDEKELDILFSFRIRGGNETWGASYLRAN